MTLISSLWNQQFAIIASDKRVTTPNQFGIYDQYNDEVTKIIYRDDYAIALHGENQTFNDTPIFPEMVESFLSENEGIVLDRLVIGLVNKIRPLDRSLRFGISIIGRQKGEIFVYLLEPGKCRIIPYTKVPDPSKIIFNYLEGCPGDTNNLSESDRTKKLLL